MENLISLAVKYRPTTFSDVVEQDNIKRILQTQIDNNDIRNVYLFTGSAGTGKTTNARIFANEINRYKGNPIEIDAASNSGVDNVRDIIDQAKTKSISSEYKIFIIDECHSLSNTAWQALLKLIEEPPQKTIFIFCTTNPEKIANTILSRVQRFDFKRISLNGIMYKLKDIIQKEGISDVEMGALEYIAKLADGGMRDAITMLDKCLAYDKKISLDNVISVLGECDNEYLDNIVYGLITNNDSTIINTIEKIHLEGFDLSQFIDKEIIYVLDILKYLQTGNMDICQQPTYVKDKYFGKYKHKNSMILITILDGIINISNSIKYNNSIKNIIEANLLLLNNKISMEMEVK